MNSRLKYLVIACLLLGSCSPRIIEHTKTEYVYRDRVVRDSLYLHDSIYVKEYVKGDTVFSQKYVYKYIYKDKYRTDTLLREVHDTTRIPVQIEKPLSWAQKTKLGAFWWLLGAVVALLAWTFRKTLLKLL